MKKNDSLEQFYKHYETNRIQNGIYQIFIVILLRIGEIDSEPESVDTSGSFSYSIVLTKST
jgi:hypothetical protein